MKNTRTPFTPKIGQIYTTNGGGNYECLKFNYADCPVLRNTVSGWTFVAHGIAIYEDGIIDWDYSTGGFFTN